MDQIEWKIHDIFIAKPGHADIVHFFGATKMKVEHRRTYVRLGLTEGFRKIGKLEKRGGWSDACSFFYVGLRAFGAQG